MPDFLRSNLTFPDLLSNDSLIDNFTIFFTDDMLSPDGGGVARRPTSPMLPYRYELDMSIQIGLYSVIFLLAVIGNSLVILTLVQNQGMRTITNLFLLNLAIADLLVGVFCMPFTLVGIVLKDFVFGSFLCKLIPYLQAVSVAVSAWTLVAISVERYYAICHPLTSRRWQTLSHAYKIIAIVWTASLICMSPIAFVSVLQPIRKTGRHKCREEWPAEALEKTYTVFLDIILLVLPLVIMAVKYGLITRTLWPANNANEQFLNEQSSMLATSAGDDSLTPAASPRLNVTTTPHSKNATTTTSANNIRTGFASSFRRHDSSSSQQSSGGVGEGSNKRKNTPNRTSPLAITVPQNQNNINSMESGYQETSIRSEESSSPISPAPGGNSNIKLPNPNNNTNNHLYRQSSAYGNPSSVQGSNPAGILRRCNVAKSLKRKKRVIQMLGVVVAEFFVCWAPLYVMNTWYLFSPTELYEMIGPVGVSLVQLLAYISCCCNPITLCVMSRGFRIAFVHVFGCHCDSRRHSTSQRNDSLRLTRNRSLYTPSFHKTTDHV